MRKEKFLTPTMRLGAIDLDLNKEIEDFKCCYATELRNFLDEFYHVDTYFNEEKKCYRIQGHISFEDMPDILPEEFINSQYNMVEKNNQLVFEVWVMEIFKTFPF